MDKPNNPRRNLTIVSVENARLIMSMCHLSGLDWYIRDKDTGEYHLVVRIPENKCGLMLFFNEHG